MSTCTHFLDSSDLCVWHATCRWYCDTRSSVATRLKEHLDWNLAMARCCRCAISCRECERHSCGECSELLVESSHELVRMIICTSNNYIQDTGAQMNEFCGRSNKLWQDQLTPGLFLPQPSRLKPYITFTQRLLSHDRKLATHNVVWAPQVGKHGPKTSILATTKGYPNRCKEAAVAYSPHLHCECRPTDEMRRRRLIKGS